MDSNIKGVAIPLEKKTTLTLEEAVAYTGIDINRLWQMSNEPDGDFVIRTGKQLVFKRKQLKEYIKVRGHVSSIRRDAEFDEIAQNDYCPKVLCSMAEYKKLNQLLQKNNGYILTAQVVDANIDKNAFYDFVKRMGLLKADHGVYVKQELYADKMYMLHLGFENAVFSHETALFIHGLIEKEPDCYTATTKTNSDGARLERDGVIVYTLPENQLKTGVIKVQTAYGNWIPVYDRERTICDIVHDQRPGTAYRIQDVMKMYAAQKDKSYGRLIKYARAFRIEKEMQQYLMPLFRKEVL